MSTVAPGWYRDPADPTTQRYWDGEGWAGSAIPADAVPPPGPPPLVAPPGQPPPGASLLGQPPPGPWPAGQSRPGTAAGAEPPHRPPPESMPPTPGRRADAEIQRRADSEIERRADAEIQRPYGRPYAAALPVPRLHGLVLASVGARFLARMVDIAAVSGLVVIANAWLAYQWWQAFLPVLRAAVYYQYNGGAEPQAPASVYWLLVAMCVVATAVWFAYEVPGSANTGQTLGKRLLGIKVMRVESGESLGFGRSMRRWGRLGLPTLLWSCYGAGLILQIIDCFFVVIDRPLHQALHDKAAATVVVRVARPINSEKSPPENSSSPTGGRHADPP